MSPVLESDIFMKTYVIYDKNGSPNVKRAQTELNSRFGSGIAVDGIWDPPAEKRLLQQCSLP